MKKLKKIHLVARVLRRSAEARPAVDEHVLAVLQFRRISAVHVGALGRAAAPPAPLQALPVEGSLVKSGGFGIRFESDFGKFVHNLVANAVKFDEIRPKSDFKSDTLD